MESSTMNDIQAMQAIVELSEHVDSKTLMPAVKSILLPYYSQWQTVAFTEAIEYLEFAAKGKSGKPRNCKKGYACGDGCISRTKECRKKHGPEAKQAQEWLKSNGALSDEQAKAEESKTENKSEQSEVVANSNEILDAIRKNEQIKAAIERRPDDSTVKIGGQQYKKVEALDLVEKKLAEQESQYIFALKNETRGEREREARFRSEINTDPELSQFVSKTQASKNYKKLGEGIEGVVYLDSSTSTPRAVKYSNPVRKRDLLKQDLDEQTAERIIREYNSDIGLQIKNATRAGELGIAPQIYGASKQGDFPVISMEFLDGYQIGYQEGNNSEFRINLSLETSAFNRSFLRKLKTAHNNKLLVDDLHAENVMFNPDTKDVKFIDQGGMKEGTSVEIAGQLFNSNLRTNGRPLAALLTSEFVKTNGTKRQSEKVSRLIEEYRTTENLSEQRSSQMVSELYGILEDLGV